MQVKTLRAFGLAVETEQVTAVHIFKTVSAQGAIKWSAHVFDPYGRESTLAEDWSTAAEAEQEVRRIFEGVIEVFP